MNKTIRSIILILCIAMLLLSGWKVWGILDGYREGQDNYTSLEQYASIPETFPPETAVPDSTDIPTEPTAPDLSGWPQVDFAQLQAINPDVVGWIFIDGTNINYPIAQGQDNSYYLNHLFDGTVNRAGCIFLDANCAPDLSDPHSIIYGHHLRDKTMFTALMAYKDQSFYDAYPTAMLVTPEYCYEISFFSGYVTNNQANAWDLHLSDEDFAQWLLDIQKKSCFRTEFEPTPQDRIITLSTCTYEFKSAKFILHGYISQAIRIPD